MEKVNDKLSEENLFWKMRDDIALDLRKKYNGKNIILDNNNIRPLTYDELNNKFAVSVEHAENGDFKTKEELEQIAKDINAEYIMFFPYEGKYGGEYSFLVKDKHTAEKIAKEYNQKAYAAFYEENKENLEDDKEKNIDKLYHERPTPKEENLSMKKPIKVRESVNCKNRKQLGKLIESLKKDNIKYKVNKSTDENFRYTISYSRVLNEEQNKDNDISFEDFLANAKVLVVDDAKTFDINQWEKENEDKLKVKDVNIVKESFDDLNKIAVNELKRKLKNINGIEFTDEKPTGFSYVSNNKDKFWFECEVDEVNSDEGKKLTEDTNTEDNEDERYRLACKRIEKFGEPFDGCRVLSVEDFIKLVKDNAEVE